MRKTLKKYFIPHEGNAYKPHIFRKASVIVLAFLIVGVLGASFGQSLLVQNSNLFSAVLPGVLIDLANADRVTSGAGELKENDLLKEAAQRKANDMAAKGYFAHVGPDGTSPWYWLSNVGYEFSRAGENLAVRFNDSASIERAWMNSPKHRANILNQGFTEIGIATAKGMYNGSEALFVVQFFGTPADNSIVRPPARAQARGGVSVSPPARPAVEGVSVSDDTFSGTDPGTEVNKKSPQEAFFVRAWQRLFTSPRGIVQVIYSVIAIILGSALFLMVGIEIRRQHPRHIMYALALILLLICAWYVYEYYIYSAVIIE